MKKLFLLLITLLMQNAIFAVQYETKRLTDKNGFSYETVINDPMGVRIYTLANGMKVYLSYNDIDTRIQTYIGVRAGSSYDPKKNTGLAHYLEHLMFKGTQKIGTLDWEKEKLLLEKIAKLYEQHKQAQTDIEKKNIYKKIDSISQIAAQYAIPNELDKMFTSIGAKGTNAYTSNEKTVYINNIPSNELSKWLQIEEERFQDFVPRLFHTELETVYEEFNKVQDNDSRKAYQTLFKSLFAGHPYGEQTTIGEAEHLKSPSIDSIFQYWKTYYVPNNMAIALSGDINYEQTIKMIDETFGKYQLQPLPIKTLPKAQTPTSIVEKEVYGPSPESVVFSYQFDGVGTEDEKKVILIDGILSNLKAGLIDINLNQKQQVQHAGCFPYFLREYGSHIFYGVPRQDQTLSEVKELILQQIEKIKQGEFEEWLIEAVINDLKLMKIETNESNTRAEECINSFINKTQWIDEVKKWDELENITKQQIVDFANKHYNENYIVVYKKQGEDKNIVKVDKPQITPVEIDRNNESKFLQQFLKIETESLQPKFINFDEEIVKIPLNDNVTLNYIKNTRNELFELVYIIKQGKRHNPKLSIAMDLLPYLGTSKYTPEQLQQELFKLGLEINTKTEEYQTEIVISGLEKNFTQAVELLNHLMTKVKPDNDIYARYVDKILKKRTDNKSSKQTILYKAMLNYAKYDSLSPFTDIIPEEELRNIKAKELTNIVKDMYNYQEILYYGQNTIEEVKSNLQKQKIPKKQLKETFAKQYKPIEISQEEVLFVDYDMVQTHILLLAKDQLFSPETLPYSILFNEYFGRGLSSIVFQEIREARALAYTAFSSYSPPKYQDENYYLIGFIGTSPDKVNEAILALNEIQNKMPKATKQFKEAQNSIVKKIESERINNMNIYKTYKKNQYLGIDYDIRKDTYNKVKNISIDEFETFFNTHIANKDYKYLILGNKNDIDFENLKKLGKVTTLSLEEIFNY